MRKLIKNNVLPYTFASVSVLVLATYDMDVKSISALWHTDYALLYTFFVSSNALLFMFGDNQLTNKLASLCCIIYHKCGHIQIYASHFALGFFIIKPLNHRRDAIFTYLGAATLFSLGLHLYLVEVIGLYRPMAGLFN